MVINHCFHSHFHSFHRIPFHATWNNKTRTVLLSHWPKTPPLLLHLLLLQSLTPLLENSALLQWLPSQSQLGPTYLQPAISRTIYFLKPKTQFLPVIALAHLCVEPGVQDCLAMGFLLELKIRPEALRLLLLLRLSLNQTLRTS